MSAKPNPEFLEQLGWVSIRWSGVELMIELSCAYLYQIGFVRTSDNAPPRPFSSRIKFIRKALGHPALTHLRCDYEPALDAILRLADKRNDLMHGAITSWEPDGSARQTVIKSDKNGYVALQEIVIDLATVSDLADRLKSAFAIHFNLHDRLKAVLRAFQGSEDVGRKAMFDE